MWRPPDWQSILAAKFGAIAPIDAKLIEAGADAMLGTLKEKGIKTIDPCLAPDASKLEVVNWGTIVFIPDE